MAEKKIKGRWMPVRHTEDQAHADWVLYLDDEEGQKQARGQQPRAVAECERQPDGRWQWRAQADDIQMGFEASADLAMAAANAYMLERMKLA